ncbi:hypothetical protein VPH35_112947 [Triticum aestivum]
MGSPWAGLPPDLLLEVSSRLQHATDLVRFHAVCRSWREAAALHSRPMCLPWVLTTCTGQMLHSIVDSRHSPEAPTCHGDHGDIILVEPPEVPPSHIKNWVASADGTGAWLFVACPDPRLINIRTGAATHLPPLPDEIRTSMKKVCGVVYGDGTVFLYRALPYISCNVIFTAAILHPKDLSWTVLMKRLELLGRHYAMYHDGKLLVFAGDSLGSVLTMMKFEANYSDNGSSLEWTWDIKSDICCPHACSYIVESHGELLLASVLVRTHCYNHYTYSDLASMMWLRIRVMQKEPSSGKIQWVERDSQDLSDHMLFLGSPTSLATKLDEGDGCAYFVFWDGVFKYNFVKSKAKFVRRLRLSRFDEVCMWLRPCPSFTPIQKIEEMIEAPISELSIA